VTYAEWIAANISDPLGKCAEYTLEMQRVFPELTRVRGHYYDIRWGERTHWWLVDLNGDIVDPTAAQFPSRGKGAYVPWEEGAEEPCGRCLNCGEECFRSSGGSSDFCSASCADALAAELNSSIRSSIFKQKSR
jgi:hypothetical protein